MQTKERLTIIILSALAGALLMHLIASSTWGGDRLEIPQNIEIKIDSTTYSNIEPMSVVALVGEGVRGVGVRDEGSRDEGVRGVGVSGEGSRGEGVRDKEVRGVGIGDEELRSVVDISVKERGAEAKSSKLKRQRGAKDNSLSNNQLTTNYIADSLYVFRDTTAGRWRATISGSNVKLRSLVLIDRHEVERIKRWEVELKGSVSPYSIWCGAGVQRRIGRLNISFDGGYDLLHAAPYVGISTSLKIWSD